MPEFLGPAVLNALGLAAFNYDFREDGQDRAEFGASLRDFMWVTYHTTGLSPYDVWASGPKGLDSLRTGKCSVKVSWFTYPRGFWRR
jgi:hypothetical protein